MPSHILVQIAHGALLVGVTAFTWWIVLTGRIPPEERGWVWGYFKRGEGGSPNLIAGVGVCLVLVGVANGCLGPLGWLGLACGAAMLGAALVRAWQLR